MNEKPIPEDKAQVTLHDARSLIKFERKPSDDEFICPVLEVSSFNEDVYVDKGYCESFGKGTGCKHIENCKAYNQGGETDVKSTD